VWTGRFRVAQRSEATRGGRGSDARGNRGAGLQVGGEATSGGKGNEASSSRRADSRCSVVGWCRARPVVPCPVKYRMGGAIAIIATKTLSMSLGGCMCLSGEQQLQQSSVQLWHMPQVRMVDLIQHQTRAGTLTCECWGGKRPRLCGWLQKSLTQRLVTCVGFQLWLLTPACTCDESITWRPPHESFQIRGCQSHPIRSLPISGAVQSGD